MYTYTQYIHVSSAFPQLEDRILWDNRSLEPFRQQLFSVDSFHVPDLQTVLHQGLAAMLVDVQLHIETMWQSGLQIMETRDSLSMWTYAQNWALEFHVSLMDNPNIARWGVK